MSLTLFIPTDSAHFECQYSSSSWGSLGTVYYCDVKNAVNITSNNAAQVDDISGKHKHGQNNDNVEAFSVTVGQIHYFPHGLSKFFKNLKGIQIGSSGLKVIHQHDLKDFLNLKDLYLWSSDLEVIEENLFEFNKKLELIYLSNNKISHIDPNVFNKLTNLRNLMLDSNTCINMGASNNPTEVQNVIKAAKAQCTSWDFSDLNQKLQNLKNESKILNLEDFRAKLENLEFQIKNSSFSNFFEEKLQFLKVVLFEKEKKDQFFDTISAITKNSSFEMCSPLELKVNNVTDNVTYLVALTENNKADHTAFNDKLVVQGTIMTEMKEKVTNISNVITVINQNYEKDKQAFLNLLKAIQKIFLPEL